MKPLGGREAWLVAGSQNLYGDRVLREVEQHAQEIAAALDGEPAIPVRVVSKGIAVTPESIRALAHEANASGPVSD